MARRRDQRAAGQAGPSHDQSTATVAVGQHRRVESQGENGGRVLRLLALIAVAGGVIALTAGACVLSYTSVHDFALHAGVSGSLAKIYPGIADAMLVIAGCAVLALRGAGLISKIYAWLCFIMLLAAIAAGSAIRPGRHSRQQALGRGHGRDLPLGTGARSVRLAAGYAAARQAPAPGRRCGRIPAGGSTVAAGGSSASAPTSGSPLPLATQLPLAPQPPPPPPVAIPAALPEAPRPAQSRPAEPVTPGAGPGTAEPGGFDRQTAFEPGGSSQAASSQAAGGSRPLPRIQATLSPSRNRIQLTAASTRSRTKQQPTGQTRISHLRPRPAAARSRPTTRAQPARPSPASVQRRSSPPTNQVSAQGSRQQPTQAPEQAGPPTRSRPMRSGPMASRPMASRPMLPADAVPADAVPADASRPMRARSTLPQPSQPRRPG